MRKLVALLVLVVTADVVSAGEPPKPDYSQDAVLKAFYIPHIELGPRPEPRVKFRFGVIEFRALGMDWRLFYLPMAMPLSGTRMGVTQTPPDPFELTGVAFPNEPAPELEPQSRELRAELKRIRRVTR